MLKPKPLFPGAKVALVAPSGAVPADRLNPAVKAVEEWGLVPVVYESCRQRHGYFAGDDALRASDIENAFADTAIDGILCIRGGYGAQRLMPLLDFDKIAKTPKFFSGYSDVTAFHIMLNQHCGFITYHTPMPSTELYKGVDDYTAQYVKKAYFGGDFGVLRNPEGQQMRTLVKGSCQGVLTGGNLSLVASSLGTPYEIDTKGKILFLEDVDESIYRIDRMLLQLKNAGKLDDCAGIILGAWTNCTADTPALSLTLDEVFNELIVLAGKPVIRDVVCGHCLPTMSLPMGSMLKMDADAAKIKIL